jgi:hypothetical protein
MDFSQSTGKGARSGITVRSEPQRDWNSFTPTETIPRSIEASILSLTEETILRREMTETKKFIQKGKMVGAFASRQQLPQRRGRPRKNEEVTKAEAMGTSEEMPSQQLKQAKLAIVELYQENRELKRQLATKTVEALAAKSHRGSVTWIKRKLKEAQNVIVQLREAQRLEGEGHAEYPGESGAVEQEVHMALTFAQEKKA